MNVKRVAIGTAFVATVVLAPCFQFTRTLFLGWFTFAVDTFPHVQVRGAAIASGAAFIALFILTLHFFARWIVRSTRGPQGVWRWKWTLCVTVLLAVMFVAGFATIALARHVGWMATTREPLYHTSVPMRGSSQDRLTEMGEGIKRRGFWQVTWPDHAARAVEKRQLSWMTRLLPSYDVKIPPIADDAWKSPKNDKYYKTVISVFLNPELLPGEVRDAEGYGLSHYSANEKVLGNNVQLDFCKLSNGVGKMGVLGSNVGVLAWRRTAGPVKGAREGPQMPAIVEYPQVVREAVDEFGDLFSCDPQRRHFAEYLTGLMVAANKTVTGINSEFAATTDQSCLNRFLTEVAWDEQALNQRRLELLQRDPTTRYSAQGVIALDDTLIDHDGKFIKDVGWFWDHAEDRNKIAHDYLFVNYVCTSGKHYPLEFRRFKKRDQCEATGETFQDHTQLFCQLVDWVCAREIPGDFTFDSYFTNAENLNHINSKQDQHGRSRGYVGDMKFNRKVQWKGKELRVDALAATIPPEDRKELRRGDQRQWCFTCTLHIPKVDHKVRIVILWNHRRDAEPCKIVVTNRTTWEVCRVMGTYRNRWTGTETYHRDGKQQLGMGDCQLRDGQGQTRHMYLVMLAYSLLVLQLRQDRARDWAHCRLKTIGEACRAMLNETLRATLTWVVQQVQEHGKDLDHVFAKVRLT